MAKSLVLVPPSNIFNRNIESLNFSIKLFILKNIYIYQIIQKKNVKDLKRNQN